MTIVGTVTAVLPVEEGVSKTTGNMWKSMTFVIKYGSDADRMRFLAFSVFGERIDKIRPLLQVGTSVTVSFDAESHEYQGRWYTKAAAWKVEPMVSAQLQQAANQPFAQPQAAPQGYPQQQPFAQPGYGQQGQYDPYNPQAR